jgi:putative transcriptional regulator
MIEHHPSDETLVRFAAGDVATGPALVLASHIAQCQACRHEVRLLENVGGAVLDNAVPVPLDDLDESIQALLADPEKAAREREREYRRKHGLADAADLAAVLLDPPHQLGPLGSVDAFRAPVKGNASRSAPTFPTGMVLPSPLAAYDISPWRFVAPGIQWAKVAVPDDATAKVLLLRARPKTPLPRHSHSGVEYTCILHGAFWDDGVLLRAGDLGECDEGHRHQPIVDECGECVCVLAVEGQLVMDGWMARIAQRIVGL